MPGVTIVHQGMETATAASTAKVSQTLQTNVSVFATLCTVQSAAELSNIWLAVAWEIFFNHCWTFPI